MIPGTVVEFPGQKGILSVRKNRGTTKIKIVEDVYVKFLGVRFFGCVHQSGKICRIGLQQQE